MKDIEAITSALAEVFPELRWKRLEVTHPATDDGLWFFWLADRDGEVQVESTSGCRPFLVETDKHDQRKVGRSVSEVVLIVTEWLRM